MLQYLTVPVTAFEQNDEYAMLTVATPAGEYRIRVQGYTWKGQRVDVGWVRLVVR